MRALVIVVLAATLGTSAAPAAAQGDIKAQAKQLVSDGLAAAKAGRYAEAIELYKQAYDLVPHPELLFNLAQAYRLEGDHETALAHYERYLAIEPRGRVATEAKKWRAEVEKAIAARKAAEAEAARKAEEARAAEAAARAEAARKAEEARRAAREAEESRRAADRKAAQDRVEQAKREAELQRGASRQSADETAPAEAPTTGSRGKRLAGIATGAGGVLLLGAGTYFGLRAQSLARDLEDHEGAWTDDVLDKEAQGERAETRMILCTGAGIAAIAAGGILYYLGRERPDAERVSIQPVIGRDVAGIVVEWR